MVIFGNKSLDDLTNFTSVRNSSSNMMKKRKAIRIAVIDDNKFEAQRNLKTYGYNIVKFDDIDSISDLEDFQIILCDVLGVGVKFSPTGQGAELVREIRNHYPNKYVLAYTGNMEDNPQAMLAKFISDDFIAKDSDMDDWSSILDKYINFLSSPIEVWKRSRLNLVRLDVSSSDIIYLEDAYVRDTLKNDQEFSKLKDVSKKLNMSGIARGIITGIIVKSVFLIAGA